VQELEARLTGLIMNRAQNMMSDAEALARLNRSASWPRKVMRWRPLSRWVD
jgi:hypothetical protein